MSDRYMGAKKQINIYKFYRACSNRDSFPGKLVVCKRNDKGGMRLKVGHAVYLYGYAYVMFNGKEGKLFQRYRLSDEIDDCKFYPDNASWSLENEECANSEPF